MKKKRWISGVLIAVIAVLGVIAWFVLPPQVVVQVGMNGQPSNTLPKLAAIAIPVVLTVFGSVANLTAKEGAGKKPILIAVVGVAVMIVTMLFNR